MVAPAEGGLQRVEWRRRLEVFGLVSMVASWERGLQLDAVESLLNDAPVSEVAPPERGLQHTAERRLGLPNDQGFGGCPVGKGIKASIGVCRSASSGGFQRSPCGKGDCSAKYATIKDGMASFRGCPAGKGIKAGLWHSMIVYRREFRRSPRWKGD